jgi:hypothetical protein
MMLLNVNTLSFSRLQHHFITKQAFEHHCRLGCGSRKGEKLTSVKGRSYVFSRLTTLRESNEAENGDAKLQNKFGEMNNLILEVSQ